MEQPFSSSKVTVEYFDPHDVYKLLAPGLIPRLPLRDLNWQSHAGPLRSISTLHVELVPAGVDYSAIFTPLSSPNPKTPGPSDTTTPAKSEDGFQTAAVGGRAGSTEQQGTPTSATLRPPAGPATKERRHQIPGLRRTPYLKVLMVRCDDNDTYKSTTRAEIREWIKTNTAQSKGGSKAENHDAFEWLIIHIVLPNSTAATQPRVSGKALESSSDTSKTAIKWRAGSSTLLEKMRADFNGSAKGGVDRVRQIRIGINDVPYNMLPRVVPAVPTGYQETEQDSDNAWADLIVKFKELILSSFDRRVTQYEEDIKERDAQRSLPGWNFCTFFILKEGLARGFESVGLVEDALVVYDELTVGLDNIIQEQAAAGSAEAHGGALLSYTEDLKELAQKAMGEISGGHLQFDEEEAVDLASGEKKRPDNFDSIPVSSSKKPYRDLILANNVSLYDFRCYIFSRQIALLLRLANAWSSREELLAKLKEQQELVPRGVAPRTPMPKVTEEPENLLHLAEICKRTLEFVPAVSAIMRGDVVTAMTVVAKGEGGQPEGGLSLDPLLSEVIDNMVASFAFSVAQQILAQTSTKALPIPPSTLGTPEIQEQKASVPEPKTMMHPARSSSLHTQSPQGGPRSPAFFAGPGRPDDALPPPYLKSGLEDLAAQRAELCALSRNILEECGKKRGWTDGWVSVPAVGETHIAEMEDVSLDEDEDKESAPKPKTDERLQTSVAGVGNTLLRTALDNKDDFYRLYETLIDKALRHYTVANHTHSVQASMADLAVLKFHLGEYNEAAFYFYRVIPFYGESGWSLLELSMLVMYARCLKELKKLDDYVNKALRQLLCKAAAAERDRLQQKSRFRIGVAAGTQYPEASAISGFLKDLLEVSASLAKDVRIPLTSLFGAMGLDGPPSYDHGQDSFSLFLELHSLLVDEFEATSVSVRISSPAAGGNKEIWSQTNGPVTIRPGPNKVKVQGTVMMAGTFEVDQIRVVSNKVLLHYERDVYQAVEKSAAALRNPRVTLYQRTSCLDVQLTGAQDLQLDKKKSLDLELSTGWNEITSCEVKIKAATGGLRLVMSEAEVIGIPQPTKSQGGVFTFGAMPANSSVKIRFPFTVENDVLDVAVRTEVAYSTDRGSFTFFKASSVPVSLALEVNVQDIFKHDALFSRFAVSTASHSPLRLLKSELLGSDLFESHFGRPPSQQVLVFPKQPASLLYKITRKPGSKFGPKVKKTLYLKLCYSVVQDEIVHLFRQALTAAMEPTPLKEFSKLIVSKVTASARNALSAYDLEKATLLGELPTSFLLAVAWEKQFVGLGGNHHASISSFLRTWLRANPTLALSQLESTSPDLPSDSDFTPTDKTKTGIKINRILIPVDIPPVSVVHTADIRLHTSLPSLTGPGGEDDYEGTPTVVINQLLPATLHLKWTRIWDTAPDSAARLDQDLEFGYEIVAAPGAGLGGGGAGGGGSGGENWLVGGRRKGHFVIPAVSSLASSSSSSSSPSCGGDEDGGWDGMSSTVETEAEIPVVLIPLREGYLPLPGVEIREVVGDGDGIGSGGGAGGGVAGGYGQCETDFRNVGETVCVVADRGKVTVSLDASGISGSGPLVLECEASGVGRGRVVV